MKILITGVTGTLGRLLYRGIMKGIEGDELIGYSRDEQKQRELSDFPGTLYLGDVRDKDRLVEASRGVDLIFHLAALKCVDTLESNPEECIATNVQGTSNVLHAQRVNRIPKVVLTSTDKAVFPINVYGASKALAEKLVLRNPNNAVCRYGNVLGSRGSVVPMFMKSIREERKVRITDQAMTRFWMTQKQAADFVMSVGLSPKTGINIPDIKAAPVLSLAQAIGYNLGEKHLLVEEIGLRPGEKMHEHLTPELSSLYAEQFDRQELRELVAL